MVDYLALPPEVNIARLLSGPGVFALETTAAAYADLAAALAATAGGTEGSTTMMGGAWGGPSSDRAQAAFRQHAGWLQRQAVVAADAASSAAELGAIFGSASEAMMGVEAWLAEWYAKQAALAAASTTQLAPLTLAGMALSELEYLAITAAAAAVMVGYDGAATAVLAGLPTPEVPLPIVNGGGPIPDGTTYNFVSPEIKNPLDTGTHTIQNDVGNHQTGDPGGDPAKTNPDPTDPKPTDPTQTTDPTQPADTTQPTEQLPDMDNPSSLSDSLGNSSLDGSGTGSMDQQGLIGASQDSTTLAGLYGGSGSMVALSMTHGGLNALPGAASGFRMPSNWSLGRGTAFGASPNPTGGGPGSRPTAPRGATAPKAQMRRRRRDEDREKSKVFVPGEPQDVPVLEQPPVIGVIEYGDADRRDELEELEESDNEQLLLVGVIGSDVEESATVDQEPAR